MTNVLSTRTELLFEQARLQITCSKQPLFIVYGPTGTDSERKKMTPDERLTRALEFLTEKGLEEGFGVFDPRPYDAKLKVIYPGWNTNGHVAEHHLIDVVLLEFWEPLISLKKILGVAFVPPWRDSTACNKLDILVAKHQKRRDLLDPKLFN